MSQKLANATALYLEGIRDGNVRATVEAYTGDRYTQHSTGVADGVDGFVEFFDPFVANNPVRDIQVVRSIVDGNYVFVHVYQDINNGDARWVTTDLFDTDDNDKIIEHWDVITAYVDETVSGHTQIDGPTETSDEDKTVANKATVASFIDDVLVHHRIGKIRDYVSSDTCIQHDPLLADGVEAFQAFMEGAGQTVVYKDIFKIVGQGDVVVSYSLVNVDGTDMATFDLFRVADGLIVEHWENSEPVPNGPQANRGKF